MSDCCDGYIDIKSYQASVRILGLPDVEDLQSLLGSLHATQDHSSESRAYIAPKKVGQINALQIRRKPGA